MNETARRWTFGPHLHGNGTATFRWFAPAVEHAELCVGSAALEECHPLTREPDGWFSATISAQPGLRYAFRSVKPQMPEGISFYPDPASRYQPDGVHGASMLVDERSTIPVLLERTRPWAEYVICELHIGTFTPEGTYLSAISRLDHLRDTGITAIELMPVAQAPGQRNWGYDGVYHYAPNATYGTPGDLRTFVSEAHRRGIAVILDVVYNHFGPDGNYIRHYAPEFFSNHHQTPWGDAIAFAVPDIRKFFAENGLYWIDVFGFDALRLDAVHTIYDDEGPSFFVELRDTIRNAVERPIYLTIEDEFKQRTRFPEYAARWENDFHHAIHTILTGEKDGMYEVVTDVGSHTAFAAVLARGVVTPDMPWPNPLKLRPVLQMSPLDTINEDDTPLGFFISFVQNHDQIGNRAYGERLTALAEPAAVEAALAIVMLAPMTPMFFMGDEWGTGTPFPYFVDVHPELAEIVKIGRSRDFSTFSHWPTDVSRVPDPSDPETFRAAILPWEELETPAAQARLSFVRHLLDLRRRFLTPWASMLRPRNAHATRVGRTGINVVWEDSERRLHLVSNLAPSELPLSGSPHETALIRSLPGIPLFRTTPLLSVDEALPPWYVGWSIEQRHSTM